MKKKLTILMLILSVAAFSQQLTSKSCGKVYNQENKKLSPSQVRELMSKNTEALHLYNQGRNKKTWGNILLYSGIGMVAADLAIAYADDGATFDAQGNRHSNSKNHVLGISGGFLMFVAIPIKIGYSKKVKSAVDTYNEKVAYSKTSEAHFGLVANDNQVGLRVTF